MIKVGFHAATLPQPLCAISNTQDKKKELEETRQKEEDRVAEQKHQDTEKLLL